MIDHQRTNATSNERCTMEDKVQWFRLDWSCWSGARVCFCHSTYSVGQISGDIPTERKARELRALDYSENRFKVFGTESELLDHSSLRLRIAIGYHSRHVHQSSQSTSYFAHRHSSKERRRCSEVGCDSGFSRPQPLPSCRYERCNIMGWCWSSTCELHDKTSPGADTTNNIISGSDVIEVDLSSEEANFLFQEG